MLCTVRKKCINVGSCIGYRKERSTDEKNETEVLPDVVADLVSSYCTRNIDFDSAEQ